MQIKLERTRNDGLNSADCSAAEAAIKTALLERYGDERAIIDAYLAHERRLHAGDPAAENGIDAWSKAAKAALASCDHLFQGWRRAPALFFSVI
jgi:hypothetical protein